MINWKPQKKKLPWELIYTVAIAMFSIYQIAKFFNTGTLPIITFVGA